MSIGDIFKKVGSAIKGFFTNNQKKIQTVITDAKIAAGVAASLATVSGETGAAKLIAGINDGLTLTSAAVSGLASNATLADHAATLSGLVTDLVAHGDIGVKSEATKADIANVVDKTTTVVQVIQATVGN